MACGLQVPFLVFLQKLQASSFEGSSSALKVYSEYRASVINDGALHFLCFSLSSHSP